MKKFSIIININTMKKSFLIIGFIFLFVGCKKEEYPKIEYPLTFKTPTPVQAISPGEIAIIEITASGGRKPYEYYVIPEEQWVAGDNIRDMLTQHDESRLYLYTHTVPLIEVKPGTTSNPRIYWIAVQDDARSATTTGTNLLAWWKKIEVFDL
jgi:hypothetical protein